MLKFQTYLQFSQFFNMICVMGTVRQFKRGTSKLDAIVNTSHYLCDDVVFCHALPNLVQCTVDWRKRKRSPPSFFPFLYVGGAAVVIYFTYRNNQSQSSSFDIEIIERK